MSSKMPFTNYKILKERMAEINKGFWKVQSIHKLSTKLSNRFSTKDFIIMKTIQKPKQYIPPFISFSNERRKYINNNKSIRIKKNNINIKNKNLFITNEIKEKINESKLKSKKERKKNLYLNLYKNFPYEPYLYNELQFIYLQGSNKLIPRKFNEVIKDCFLMDNYKKLLLNKKSNLSNFKFNDSKSQSKFTLPTNQSNNYNIEDKYLKSISVERSINPRKKRNIYKKCRTENYELEFNNNYLFNKISNSKSSRKYNHLPIINDKHLTEGNI